MVKPLFRVDVALRLALVGVSAVMVSGFSCEESEAGCAASGSSLLQMNKNILAAKSQPPGGGKGRGRDDDTTTDSPTTAGPTTTITTTGTAGASAWPYTIMTCPEGGVLTTPSMTCAQYDSMTQTIRGMYDSLDSACNATYCPQADWAGCVLRVAGHDLMDYANGVGGSDGCLDFTDHDNTGLAECMHSGEFGHSIYDAYKAHCTEISLADFIVLAAEAVMTLSREHVTDADPERESIDFRSEFRWGRTTATSCMWSKGRLPNPENSCSAVETTFVNRMGLDWKQTAALMGVHSLGRAKVANSGYDGWWSDAENSRKFNNNYFASIVAKGWMPEQMSANKNQWRRSDQGLSDEAVNGKEMMLNTDLCLFFTKDREGSVELNAASSDCCAWIGPESVSDAVELHLGGKFCGTTDIRGQDDFRGQRELCCDGIRDREIDCSIPPAGPAHREVRKFANEEDQWIRNFGRAWTAATENGFTNLQRLTSC